MGGVSYIQFYFGFLELFNFAKHLSQPPPRVAQVLKLLLICALFILSGTLPFVDNMELLGGYVFGALTGIIVLPYITFGKWHAMRKRVIIAVAVPVLLISIFAVFFLFLHVQWISSLCTACRKINCVPYTKTMCKIDELW